MALALGWHHPTVVPVEVVQVGLVLVGFQTGVGGAAGIVLPGSTLQQSMRQAGQGGQAAARGSQGMLQVPGSCTAYNKKCSAARTSTPANPWALWTEELMAAAMWSWKSRRSHPHQELVPA